MPLGSAEACSMPHRLTHGGKKFELNWVGRLGAMGRLESCSEQGISARLPTITIQDRGIGVDCGVAGVHSLPLWTTGPARSHGERGRGICSCLQEYLAASLSEVLRWRTNRAIVLPVSELSF